MVAKRVVSFFQTYKIHIITSIISSLVPIILVIIFSLGNVVAWAYRGGVEKQAEYVTQEDFKRGKEEVQGKIFEKSTYFKEQLRETNQKLNDLDMKINLICICLGIDPKTGNRIRK